MLPIAQVPLTKARGVFKPCMWCGHTFGRVITAPLIEPALHAGRMICEGCNRQIGWLNASALRRVEATSPAIKTPSTSAPSAGCTAHSESAADAISDPAQTSSPEPSTAGEGVPPLSPAILSDEEVVPAFMKDKPGCLKLRDGHCKISFATEALCAECADKRARAMA